MPCYNTAPYKRLQHVLRLSMNLTANTARQRTRPCNGFSCDCTHLTANDTRPAKADMPLPAPRWSISQRRSTSSEYQIPAPRRTLYRTAQPPYYNKVYKGAAVRRCYGSMPDCAAYRRPCQPGGVSVSTCTGSARRLAIWHRSAVRAHRLAPSTRRAVQQQGRCRRRGTIGGSRRISFRAFAR